MKARTIGLGLALVVASAASSVWAADYVGAYSPTPAGQGADWRVGKINCNVSDTMGVIFGPTRAFDCVFTNKRTGRSEHYTGEAKHTGVMLGYSGPATISYGVVSSVKQPARGALAGSYIDEHTMTVVGVGKRTYIDPLVGGVNNSIALVPIPGQPSVDFNIAAGANSISLVYQGPAR